MKATPKLVLELVLTAIPIIATHAYGQQFNSVSQVNESMPSPVMQPVQASPIAPGATSNSVGLPSNNSNMSDSIKDLQNSVTSSIKQGKSSSDIQSLIKSASMQTQLTTTWNDNRGVWKNDSLLNTCMLSSKSGIISDPCR